MKCLLILALLSTAAMADQATAILTAYCPCKICCGDFPGKIRSQTASGKLAATGRTLAMPQQFQFGSQVYLEGKLLGICEDRGGKICMKSGKVKIDIFMATHKQAIDFGVKKVVVEIKKGKK